MDLTQMESNQIRGYVHQLEVDISGKARTDIDRMDFYEIREYVVVLESEVAYQSA